MTGFTKVRDLKSTRKWLIGNRVRSMSTTVPFTALRITAGVMNWVYHTGAGGSTPQWGASPLPPQPVINEAEYLKVGQSSVVLTIFTAQAEFNPSQVIWEELCRFERSHPPRMLKCELIYVCNPLPLHQLPGVLICFSDREGRA